jgi:hypothetical protein
MKIKLFFLSFTLLLTLNSCIDVNEEFVNVRNKVIKNFGDDYKSEVQFSLGSAGITVSSWIVNTSENDELASDILADVSSIQVGVYQKFKGSSTLDISTLHVIEKNMLESGWKSIVMSSEDNDLSAVYVRKNPNEILNRLFIINYDGEELVLIEIEGDLKEAVSTVIREKGMNINI